MEGQYSPVLPVESQSLSQKNKCCGPNIKEKRKIHTGDKCDCPVLIEKRRSV